MVTPEQRAKVLGPWSGPAPDPSLIRDELLHELFEASADAGPERTAVLCGAARLSYRGLDERANRVAHWLRARGVGRGDRVALLMPRCEDAYAAMLGALKAGAAYVPLYPETPPDRAGFILKDCGAKCLLTVSGQIARLGPAVCAGLAALRFDADEGPLAEMPSSRLGRAETGASRSDLCYVIYTSGTTGRPKGVQVEHRNAAHLVRAEARLYGVGPEDKVLQMASLAFDLSVEEIWMAFFPGATLVAANDEMARAGPDLPRILEGLGVTFLSCVPTFLSTMERDIATLRVLTLGGEVLPRELAARWMRPGRKVFNTYGPTEATVIATGALLSPGRPVTIGRPIANCRVFLLDERLEPVAPGEAGELCIAGEGVARGYLNRPELDAEKFVAVGGLAAGPLRLYRTGDLARFSPEGELEYLGRADDQVKIRGFRVELSEIEAVLSRCPGVLAAAAAVRADTQRIAAYVVAREGARLDRALILRELSARLAPYMVPAFLDEARSLPATASGKIDRKRLPAPRRPLSAEGEPRVAPRTQREKTVAGVWESVLGREGVSVREDFFLDLGGHSLLAAVAVSKLRRLPGFEGVSVADLYANPTVEKLAGAAASAAEPEAPPPFHSAPTAAYLACAAGQALGVIFLSGLYAWEWLGVFLSYGYLVVKDWPIREALLVALLVYLVTTPALLAFSIAMKWLLLGRIRPGSYPLWGWFYFRFWLVRTVTRSVPVHYLTGTPFINLYFRLMGAKIGPNVFISNIGSRRSGGMVTYDVLSIGEGSSIGVESSFDGSWVEGGMLHVAPVTIGKRCWVGNRCSLGGGSELEDGAGLGDLSMLPDGCRVPAGELWRGSPAALAGRLEPEEPRRLWTPATSAALFVGAFLFPLVILSSVLPGLALITHFAHGSEGYEFLALSPVIAISFIVFLCLEAWVFKRLLIGRLREGRYPIASSFYVRKWFFDRIMEMSLEVVGTLYTTLYLRPWLKILGARIGPRSEIDAIRFEPDLFMAGAECFMAEDVLIGAPRVRSGWVTLGAVTLGDRSFAGAGSILPAGTRLGNDVLIGTLAIPPDGPPVSDGSTWFGSPPIQLPARHRSEEYSESQTYKPPARLVALRLFIELFRVILPATLFVMLASLIMDTTDILQEYIRLGHWLLIVPFLYVVAGIVAILVTVAIKWALIGRFRAGEQPLWCSFVWRSELVGGVYSHLCVPFFLELLRGTPFIAWPLRALGMKIGRRCYINTTWFSEFELNEIGDEVALNDNTCPQTHLFEGRVMNMGRVCVGDHCSVGAESALQYNSELAPGSTLGEMSLLVKGEYLPAGTRWHGIPARRELIRPAWRNRDLI